MISGPRPRPHRRHARQARRDPRLRHRRPTATASRAVVARGRLRDRRPDRRPRARRPAPVRHPRRDRHRRVDPADRRLDPVQEARRRPRRAGDGRQGRLGRVHARARPGAASWRSAIVEVAARQRPADRRAADRHGPACSAAPPATPSRCASRSTTSPARRTRAAPARGHARRCARGCCGSAGLADGDPRGRRCESGAAAERFARMVAALGGPRDLLERPDDHLPAAPVTVRGAARRAPASSPAHRRARRRPRRHRPRRRPAPRGRRDRPRRRPHRRRRARRARRAQGRPLAIVHARDEADGRRAPPRRCAAAFRVGDRAGDPEPVVARGAER